MDRGDGTHSLPSPRLSAIEAFLPKAGSRVTNQIKGREGGMDFFATEKSN